MYMHPQLDLADEILRILGWPTLLGVLVWAIRTWDQGQQQFKEIDTNTKTAVQSVTQVKEQVERIETNHLKHLQEGIIQVAMSNDKAVTVLQDINTGIKILVDRQPRA